MIATGTRVALFRGYLHRRSSWFSGVICNTCGWKDQPEDVMPIVIGDDWEDIKVAVQGRDDASFRTPNRSCGSGNWFARRRVQFEAPVNGGSGVFTDNTLPG